MSTENRTEPVRPMTLDEVTELWKSMARGDELLIFDVRRMFATLAAWAPKTDTGPTASQVAALDRYDALMDRAGRSIATIDAVEVAQALADSLRPMQAAPLDGNGATH